MSSDDDYLFVSVVCSQKRPNANKSPPRINAIQLMKAKKNTFFSISLFFWRNFRNRFSWFEIWQMGRIVQCSLSADVIPGSVSSSTSSIFVFLIRCRCAKIKFEKKSLSVDRAGALGAAIMAREQWSFHFKPMPCTVRLVAMPRK